MLTIMSSIMFREKRPQPLHLARTFPPLALRFWSDAGRLSLPDYPDGISASTADLESCLFLKLPNSCTQIEKI